MKRGNERDRRTEQDDEIGSIEALDVKPEQPECQSREGDVAFVVRWNKEQTLAEPDSVLAEPAIGIPG